jgi:hypothetical protein
VNPQIMNPQIIETGGFSNTFLGVMDAAYRPTTDTTGK